jgi:hypothetical protein
MTRATVDPSRAHGVNLALQSNILVSIWLFARLLAIHRMCHMQL